MHGALGTSSWPADRAGYGRLDRLRTPNEVGEKLFIDFHPALILGEVSLVMSLEEDLHVRGARAEGMHHRLKHRDPIFRAIALTPERCKREPVRRAVGKVETAVRVEVFVLSVFQPTVRGRHHAKILVACGRLGLESLDPHEIVELGLAHLRKSRFVPRMNIFGPTASFLAKEPACEDRCCHSSDVRKAGLILRSTRSSAC